MDDYYLIRRKRKKIMDDILFNEIGLWSKQELPDASAISHIIKLKHEADEVIADPGNHEEYADCLIALVAGAWKSGITLDELIKATENKLLINKKRKWIKQADGIYQHKE